jgi:hypothetical protein
LIHTIFMMIIKCHKSIHLYHPSFKPCWRYSHYKISCRVYVKNGRIWFIVCLYNLHNYHNNSISSLFSDSKPHLRSNVYIFNETQGKGDLSTKLQAAHIPKTPVLLTNGLTNITDVKYQQDVPWLLTIHHLRSWK